MSTQERRPMIPSFVVRNFPIAEPENNNTHVSRYPTGNNGQDYSRVRSCIIRELISPAGSYHLPIVLTTTDIRTPKVGQILANDTVQINWWIAPSMHQFRLTCNVTLVSEPVNGVFGSGGNLGFERFSVECFDWEAMQVQVFDGLSGRVRAC
jgi:pyridoxamine 5'-phosphate oxidase